MSSYRSLRFAYWVVLHRNELSIVRATVEVVRRGLNLQVKLPSVSDTISQANLSGREKLILEEFFSTILNVRYERFIDTFKVHTLNNLSVNFCRKLLMHIEDINILVAHYSNFLIVWRCVSFLSFNDKNLIKLKFYTHDFQEIFIFPSR